MLGIYYYRVVRGCRSFSKLQHEGNKWFERSQISVVADVNLQNSGGIP